MTVRVTTLKGAEAGRYYTEQLSPPTTSTPVSHRAAGTEMVPPSSVSTGRSMTGRSWR